MDSQRLLTLATPIGRGAVATVMVESEHVAQHLAVYFRPHHPIDLAQLPAGRLVYGSWVHDGQCSEDVVVCLRSGSQAEIHCHGGLAAHDAISASLQRIGFDEVSWEQWCRVAGEDPISVAARQALASVRTQRAAAILLDQLRGSLGRTLRQLILALSNRKFDHAREMLKQLIDWAPLGLHLVSPWSVVFAGPPNVGKSSLINAILGYDRAIVFDQPGTTRDVVSAITAVQGWTFQFSDTAGLRATRDQLESSGIQRAKQQLEQADQVVLIFDACQPCPSDADKLYREYPQALRVMNKCDLIDPEERPQMPEEVIWTSARQGVGIEGLLTQIVDGLIPSPPPPGTAVPFTEGQLQSLKDAYQLLDRRAPDQAIEVLHEMLRVSPNESL